MDAFFEQEQFDPEASFTFGKSSSTASRDKKPATEEGSLTVDVYQTEDDIVIQSTIAGVVADDLDISVTNDMVTIRGRRQPEDKIKPQDYDYQEIYWGQFSRTIILPEDIDADKVKAALKNGVLTLRLPKLAKSKIKKIKISS